MPSENNKRSKSLALSRVSVFAVLNALTDLVPVSPILGIPGSFLTFGWIISPLTGILLGAKIGGISCLIGNLLTVFFGKQLLFGPLTPLRPAVSAFIAGMLASSNWQIPAATLFSLIMIWFLLPSGMQASLVVVYHFFGLGIILFLRSKIAKFVSSENLRKASIGFATATYCGNISRHIFGNILSAMILNIPPIAFVWAMPYTFVEQSVFVVAATIIGISLKRLGIRQILQ